MAKTSLKRSKPLVLRAVRPNAGLETAYRRKIEAVIAEMATSVEYWIRAAYRANEPEIAQDGSPAAALRAAMRRLRRRWLTRFDKAALDLAGYFAQSTSDRSDAQLKAILKDAGLTVDFRMTRAQNDVLQATINENVSLIKSIPQQYLSNVEGIVMRGVTTGRDLGQISKDLQAQHGVTKRRAALISRDQANKASASLARARQIELGLTEAIWQHSGAGKHPRPSHVAANGKKYDVRQGMYLDGEWVLPGQAINCRCVSKSVIPGFA